jgi:heme-degrading monooxygenase HmoA
LFIGNNRFYVRRGSEKEFERIWTNREGLLKESEGFISISLLRGTTTSESTLYISNSIWKSRIHFENWKNTDNFKLTVKNTSRNKDLFIGFPNFEGLQEVES